MSGRALAKRASCRRSTSPSAPSTLTGSVTTAGPPDGAGPQPRARSSVSHTPGNRRNADEIWAKIDASPGETTPTLGSDHGNTEPAGVPSALLRRFPEKRKSVGAVGGP
jgi:hypothetical protein